MAKALYIHLPFCAAKCAYCDFNSFARSEHLIDDYLQALATELKLLVGENRGEVLSTIYIGGGTPSVLAPSQLEFLFATIRENFEFDGARDEGVHGAGVRDVGSHDLSNIVEYTIEINPGTLTPVKIAAIQAGGINRVSIGAQAFQDHLIAGLGRIHNAAEIVTAVEELKAAGLHNLSLDLMFGIPGQTLADLKISLDQAIALDLPHLSVYSLILEEGTTFGRLAAEGKLDLPSESDELAMFELVMSTLKENGYNHYEISNYARPGFESRHNTTYWQNEEYLGAGAGAHGYLHGVRYENQPDIEKYISTLIGSNSLIGNNLTSGLLDSAGLDNLQIIRHQPSIIEQRENTMILGLRMLAGVSLGAYRARYGSDLLADYADEIVHLLQAGLVELVPASSVPAADKPDTRFHLDTRLRLTPKGLIFGNQVFAEFLK
jgi:oxygen-independent coproporphyrinogen-3 oxidase